MADKKVTSPTEALAGVIKPMLNELQAANTAVTVSEVQQVLLKMDTIIVRLSVLEGLVAGAKKSPARGGQAKPAAESAVAPTDGAAVPTNEEKKAFPVNKLVYFRKMFQTNPEYRAKYVTEEIQAMMDADTTITGKQKEEQKLIAQATFCWNYFKTKHAATAELIETEYKQAKEAHEALNKPPQQNVEERTPPSTPTGEKATEDIA